MTRTDLIQEMLEDVYDKIKDHNTPTWNPDYWKGYCKASEYAWGYSDLYDSLSNKVNQLFDNIRKQNQYPFVGIK